jgi:hypothetical protein
MTDLRQDYLRWLTRQVGTQERPRGSNRQPYAALAGHANGLPWCATFLAAGAREVGLQLPPGAGTASCALNEAAYKRAGRLSTKPRVGATGFVYFPSLQRPAHTFAVWKISNNGRTIHTIEANSNDDGSREGYEVCLRTRPAHRATGAVGVRSYGMPLYEEEEVMDLTKANLRDITEAVLSPANLKLIGEAVLDAPIELTAAAAAAIGSDLKAGDEVSLRYALQWSPLARRLGREDAARDQKVQEAVDNLTAVVGRLGQSAAAGGIDTNVLATAITSRLTGPLATAVADQLAARLRA